MDSVKRNTLRLMETTALKLAPRQAGIHLILIAADWVREEDVTEATRVLSLVTDDFLTNCLFGNVLGSPDVKEAVALLVEALGVVDFRLLRSRGIEA